MYIEAEKSIELISMNRKHICELQTNREKFSAFIMLKKSCQEIFYTTMKSGMKRTVFKILCRLKPSLIYDKQLIYSEYEDDETDYNYSLIDGKKRIAVYTAIFGDYDLLNEPDYISPICDYYIFTDRDIPEQSVWKKIDVSNYPYLMDLDDYHVSKYIKMFPNIFFDDYEYSIWVDGATHIVGDIAAFIDRLGDKCIGMFNNPVHDSIYTEANYLLYYNRVKESEIKKQINVYRSEGFPNHYGMFECTIIARKHFDEHCIDIMNRWWEEVNKFTMRDQISFPYVLWKYGYGIEYVSILGENRFFNPRISFNMHQRTIMYHR